VKVSEVKISDAGQKPDTEAILTVLNDRLMKSVEAGKISMEAASRALAKFSSSGDTQAFEQLIIEVEKVERVQQEGDVITNMPERRGIVDAKETDPDEEEDEAFEAEVLKNEYFAAVILPDELTPEVKEKFIPIDLPSGNLFYGVNEIRAKPLGFSNMKKMSNILARQSLDIMVNAIAPCISIDIRKLTQGDFIYFLYWLRTMSLPRTPITMRWRSRYGTMESLSIDMTKIKENRIKLSPVKKKEFASFQAAGFDFPRVYDMLAASRYEHEKFEMEDVWTIERVQFFSPEAGETFGDRIDRVSEMMEDSLSLLEDLKDFRKLFEHGVEEIAKVQADPDKFDPVKAADHLEDQANRMEAAISIYGFDQKMQEDLISFREEAKEIRATLEKGGKAVPRIETIRCEIDALSFFSAI
jgi:hypothetical protein